MAGPVLLNMSRAAWFSAFWIVTRRPADGEILLVSLKLCGNFLPNSLGISLANTQGDNDGMTGYESGVNDLLGDGADWGRLRWNEPLTGAGFRVFVMPRVAIGPFAAVGDPSRWQGRPILLVEGGLRYSG